MKVLVEYDNFPKDVMQRARLMRMAGEWFAENS
jgi:hypothetical protein